METVQSSKLDEFCIKMADILEVDTLKPEDELRGFEMWDSLAALTTIAMSGSHYGVTLSAADLKSVNTVRELFELITGRR